DEDEDGEAEAGDRAVRRAPPAPAGGGAEEEDDRDERPGRVAEDRADELAADPELRAVRLRDEDGAEEDADREEREAGEEKAVLGAIERIERRQALEEPLELLLLEEPLLHEVERRRAEREGEEGDPEEVHRHVERDERALEAWRLVEDA